MLSVITEGFLQGRESEEQLNNKKKTYLARSIEIADEKVQYDAYAKKIISDKTILSWIAKYAISELKGYSISEIRSCIEGEPEVATVPVYPGDVNTRIGKQGVAVEEYETEAIIGLPTEDKVPNEGTVTYDVRFHLIIPQENCFIVRGCYQLRWIRNLRRRTIMTSKKYTQSIFK